MFQTFQEKVNTTISFSFIRRPNQIEYRHEHHKQFIRRKICDDLPEKRFSIGTSKLNIHKTIGRNEFKQWTTHFLSATNCSQFSFLSLSNHNDFQGLGLFYFILPTSRTMRLPIHLRNSAKNRQNCNLWRFGFINRAWIWKPHSPIS